MPHRWRIMCWPPIPRSSSGSRAGPAWWPAHLSDPVLRGAEGAALLGQSLAQEANILAYNDVFRLVTMLALVTAAYVFYRIAWLAHEARRNRRTGAVT